MPKLVILITARIEEAHTLGEVWQNVGAPGVTFIEGYGIGRLQEKSKHFEVLPGVVSMLQLLRENEETSLIMLSVVNEDDVVDKIIAATEGILGNLALPDNGIAFVIDVERTFGVRRHK